MALALTLRQVADRLTSVGSYAEESDRQRARRRIMAAAIWLASLLTAPMIIDDVGAGRSWVAGINTAGVVASACALIGLQLRPRLFPLIVNLLLAAFFLSQVFETTALGIRAASWWLAAYVASIVYAVVIPNWVEPMYAMSGPQVDAAYNMIATGIVTFVVMVYFVRQRDRFQMQSDNLLHNILPDDVAGRLKRGDATIADSFPSASVLFVDVVDFTPLSARLTPPEVVGLLDSVFTTFDGLVGELGLEKIKTVGDAYMVAGGVPKPRPDHAEAIAELALRIRDHVATHNFRGHSIQVRIGINTGPVIAGIIGRHKFAYDLWGDVVNTASRMESYGVPGSIQVSKSTFELIRDRFNCEPRGLIAVKGNGELPTFILVSRRTGRPAPSDRSPGPANTVVAASSSA